RTWCDVRVHGTSDDVRSVRRLPILSGHRYLNDISRQLRRVRNFAGYGRGSEGPSGSVQSAIGSRVQINAGIWGRGEQRAFCQKVALPTTLHISCTLYKISRDSVGVWNRAAATVRHLIDQESATL